MKNSTTSEAQSPAAGELCRFLSDYGAALMSSGATCIRLEKNISRIARHFGKEAEVAVMPRHLHLSLLEEEPGMNPVTAISDFRQGAISFMTNTALSRLSWEIADGKISFGEAVAQFRDIVSPKTQRAHAKILILAALANASFCRLFDGDATAMAVVFAATAVGFYLKLLLTRMRLDTRVTVLLCAFVSSVVGASDALFSLGGTPMTAIGTSVLYLVPGVPFLNSFSDFLYRHYLCAFSRLTDALTLTCCLSIGLCAAMFLMRIGMF